MKKSNAVIPSSGREMTRYSKVRHVPRYTRTQTK
jgi:hypothetical protein